MCHWHVIPEGKFTIKDAEEVLWCDVKTLWNQHVFGIISRMIFNLYYNLNSPQKTVYHTYIFWKWNYVGLKMVYADYEMVYADY